MCLEFQTTQPKDKPIPHDIPYKPLETVGADIFMLSNKGYSSIVDYQCEFPAVKQMDGLSANSLIKTCKIIIVEYGL